MIFLHVRMNGTEIVGLTLPYRKFIYILTVVMYVKNASDNLILVSTQA